MGGKLLKNKALCKILFKSLTLIALCFFAVNCAQKTKDFTSPKTPIKVSENAININSATVDKLQQLPNVGEKTAQKIVAHREKFGSFRRAEHLMLVEGISDKRFRKMRSMIKVK